MNILVTGGAGYIGSHTLVELLSNNHRVTVVDNLINSSRESLHRVERITGKSINFHKSDLRDKAQLTALFDDQPIDAVIHFAGLKAVGESIIDPLLYYQTNLDSTLVLLEVMQAHKVKRLIFSSSATVYGDAPFPYKETSPTGHGITNPYGRTKYMIEQILQDVAAADQSRQFTILRYFNPIGAHESGLIGEHPQGTPNNLMPYITQVATGIRKKLSIFGGDYPTKDGTGVRDYIHVVDLAKGHVASLSNNQTGCTIYNLGTGRGTSVLELVTTFEKTSGIPINYEIIQRRSGDLPISYADASKALRELNWKAVKTIEDACRDSWRWQSQNPQGY